MMPTLCATMSCSSRAIRSRSASAVWVAAWARSASALAWASRIEFPISQARTAARGKAIVTRCTSDPPMVSECAPGNGMLRNGISTLTPTTMAMPATETRRLRVAAM